jgi:general nucleoside transport system permease protein
VGIFLALAAVLVVYVLLWKAIAGWRLRAVGENPVAARFVGINVPRQIVLSMLISGGLAGLAGMVEISGVRGALTSDFSPSYGFTAIAVALLGGLHPVGVTVAAFFFAFLSAGAEGLQRSVGINSSTVFIVQGLVLVFVIGRRAFLREK